jgi:inositol transport system permease protein
MKAAEAGNHGAQSVTGILKNVFSKYAIYFAFVVLCIILAFLSPNFFTLSNATNVLKQATILGIIAMGMTMVLILGGIDLSSGSVIALTGVISAIFAAPGGISEAFSGFVHDQVGTEELLASSSSLPLIVPILVALLVGLLTGVFNGFITAKGKVPPFIVTLGMMTIARGAALLAADGGTVPYVTDEYKAIGGGSFLGVPILIYVFALVFIVTAFLLYKTRFGRHVYAIGGNETAAHVSGVHIDRVKIMVYMLAGTLSGLAGLLLASRIACGSPVSGQGYELDAIAACVIGGTSLSGGVGKLLGTVVGVLFIGVMSNGLDMMNVSSYYQQITKGVIIILAVLYDARSKNKRNG